jgi:hypothetical protein
LVFYGIGVLEFGFEFRRIGVPAFGGIDQANKLLHFAYGHIFDDGLWLHDEAFKKFFPEDSSL